MKLFFCDFTSVHCVSVSLGPGLVRHNQAFQLQKASIKVDKTHSGEDSRTDLAARAA